MIEDKKARHRNKPNRMSDAEIMVILILFHSGGFRCFKHYYKEYVCKHLKHLFTRLMSYNLFIELERKYCFLWPFSSKKSCWRHVPASVLSILQSCVFAATNVYWSTRHLRGLQSTEEVQWDSSSDSNCTR